MSRYFFLLIFFCAFSFSSFSQELSDKSIKVGAGLAINEGYREIGTGTVFQLGYQKQYWENRLRLNPYMLTGGFIPFGITDTPDQYFRITTLGTNLYLDVIRIKPFSLFAGTGLWANYSRGLIGTGGMDEPRTSSDYFFRTYIGGSLHAGIRLAPQKSRLAWEITPFNVHFGSGYFMLGYLKIGVDISL
ncbi:MAG: hypothetical protein JXA77_05550 [Bacteroidales bacterium]|nr:hypothetical protein [Bacteroidales bacterium]MBN2818063.1 hypothetical protein [Bacteroidales bacterium]